MLLLLLSLSTLDWKDRRSVRTDDSEKISPRKNEEHDRVHLTTLNMGYIRLVFGFIAVVQDPRLRRERF